MSTSRPDRTIEAHQTLIVCLLNGEFKTLTIREGALAGVSFPSSRKSSE
jgi:hypothetical protein